MSDAIDHIRDCAEKGAPATQWQRRTLLARIDELENDVEERRSKEGRLAGDLLGLMKRADRAEAEAACADRNHVTIEAALARCVARTDRLRGLARAAHWACDQMKWVSDGNGWGGAMVRALDALEDGDL